MVEFVYQVLNSDGHSLGGSAHVPPSFGRRLRGTGQQIVLVLAQPLNSSEVFLSQFPAAVLGEPCDEVPHSRVQGRHPHLVWRLGPQVALTEVGSHLLERYAQVVLAAPQCELGISVGVGNWFPPFQFSRQGVIYAPAAQCGGVNEDGLALISPGAEVCLCEILLLPESAVFVCLQLLVEFLDRADCQACVPYRVAFDLVGDGLCPRRQIGEDILLDFQPGRFGGDVGGQDFDCPVVGEPAAAGPEFKLGLLVPVWVDSYLPGFSSGTFGVRWLWQRRQ